jgi:hypothetical protein
MLLCTVAWTRYGRDAAGGGPGSAVGLALGPWVRPDAAVLAGVVGLWHGVRRGPVFTRAAARSAGVVVASAGALVATKLWLFGAVLPLTFHTKTAGDRADRGAAYLEAFLTTPRGLLPGLLLAGVGVGLFWAIRRDDRGLPALVALTWLAMVGLVGGDFMADFRLLVPAWPALCAGLALLAEAALAAARRARLEGVGAAAVTVVVGAALWAPAQVARIDQLNRVAGPNDALPQVSSTKSAPLWAPWRTDGWDDGLEGRMPYPAAWALAHAPDGAAVSYTDIGLLGWVVPQVVVIDQLGLTDPVMAGRVPGRAPWPYLSERLDWMIIDTEGGTWGRYRDRLAADGWRALGGCESIWVLANPASTAGAASVEVVAARIDDLLARSPHHRELHAAVATELLLVDGAEPLLKATLDRLDALHGDGWWPGGFDRRRCGRNGSWADETVMVEPDRWPAPLAYNGKVDDPMQVAADPYEERQALLRVECAAAREAARAGWEAAAAAWTDAPGAASHPPRRLARRAAGQVVLAAGGLSLAREAAAAAEAAGDPPAAVEASRAALAATEAAVAPCAALDPAE